MTLDEAIKIKESLEELSADPEVFNWGPTLTFAKERKREALRIIRSEIKRLKEIDRSDLKEIKSSLGYSRIGRNNV